MKRPSPAALKDIRSSTMMRWPSLSYSTLPVTILIITIAVCLIGYSLAIVNLEGSRNRSVNRTMRENGLRINGVFDSYAHVLWGSSGRVQSGEVNQQSWTQFMDVYDLPQNFSGLEGAGLLYGSTPDNQSLTYVTPSTDDTTKKIGFNLGSVPGLKQTMNQAAVSGTTTATGPLPSIFSTKLGDSSSRPGFLMFNPFYDTSLPTATAADRQAALRGFSVASFRGDIFFDGMFKDLDLSHTRMKVYLGDVSSSNLLYTTGTITTGDTRTSTQKITEYGRTFTIVYTLDTAYMLVWSLTYFPLILLVGGLFMGIAFAVISGFLLRSRFRRLIYEKERDVEFAKDELLSLASHQLRTPATGVKQYLGMVLQGFAGDVSDKQRNYLERAYASNNRQLGVINDILHMAKLESGRIVLAEREFDLSQMVHEVVDEQTDDANKGEIILNLDAPIQAKMIGDSHMLRMVIENLVSNAIKYTPAGGKVTIKLIRRGSWWALSVKDSGVGIAKADFSKLFKQFSRINNPRSEFVTGTGVGLYLAYHLTVLHGGTLGVTSTKGKGSTFTVRLPRKM